MQSSKTSNKARKIADDATPVADATTQAATKSRSTRSASKSKSIESAETNALKHRRAATKAAATVQEGEAQASTRPVTREDVALLAHSYWIARGYAPGSPEEDWLRAEKELQAQG
jgi:hypothetical protein